MKARLVGFRRSKRSVYNNYGILEVKNKDVASLIGNNVVWSNENGKAISGVIIRTHGKRTLLARFKKGLSGDALGSIVVIGPVHLEMKKIAKKTKQKTTKKVKKTEKQKTTKKVKKTEKQKTPKKTKQKTTKKVKKTEKQKTPKKTKQKTTKK
jgi:ribosomal protein L35AE/L33A